jgi:hypothetical protein
MYIVLTFLLVLTIAGCAPATSPVLPEEAAGHSAADADSLLIVDCMLPGRIHRLGTMTYLTARRPVKTSAHDCELRGGEYVAYDRASYATALKVWLSLAQEGDPKAQTFVGEIYQKGMGTRPDYVAAAHWYRKAAEKGYPSAQINLGYLYERGLGVKQDRLIALNWYRRASGLEGEDLAYAASVEVSAERDRELAEARSELEQRDREIADLKRRMTGTEQSLRKRREQLRRAREEVEEMRRLLETLRRERGAGSVEKVPPPASGLPAVEASMIASLEEDKRRLEEEIRTLERTRSSERAEAEHRQRVLEERLAQSARDVKALRTEVEDARGQLDAYRTRLASRRAELERQRAAAEKERAALRERLRLAEEGGAEEAARLRARLEEKQRVLDSLAKGLRGEAAWSEELSAARERERSLRERLRREEEEALATRRRLAELEAQSAGLQRELKAREDELRSADLELQALAAALERERKLPDAAGGRVEELEREASERQAELDRRRRELAALKERIRSAGKREQALRERVQDRERQAAEARRRFAEVQARFGDLERELQAKEQQLRASDQALAVLSTKLERERKESGLHSAKVDTLEKQVSERHAELDRQRLAMASLEERLRTTGLELAAATETAEAAQARLRDRAETERRALEAARAELAEADTRLAEADTRLTQARRELSSKEAELARERQRFAAALGEKEREVSALRARSGAEIHALEQKLEAREAELTAERREIERLAAKADSDRKRIADLEATAEAGLPAEGPAIEIIDPPLMVTRGETMVKLRGVTPSRKVLGRVSAAAGLKAVLINDRTVGVDDNGLFDIDVPVKSDRTEVRVSAVDRNGQRAALSFWLVKERDMKLADPDAVSAKIRGVDFGAYFALVVGNDLYRLLPPLKSAVRDARAVARLLEQEYGFRVTLLEDANRYTLLSELNKLRAKLTEKDNLLIYYAGHGELKGPGIKGYWLPIDAEPDSSTNWISNTMITETIGAMSAKHVMIVADSCYSGSLTRSSVARLSTGMSSVAMAKWYKVMIRLQSRTVLTSGGLQPVLDSGDGGEHSIFAKALLDALKDRKTVVEGYQLYRQVIDRVRKEAARLDVEQVPQYAPLKYAGHESGEFFFVPKSVQIGRYLPPGPATDRLLAAREFVSTREDAPAHVFTGRRFIPRRRMAFRR